MFSWITTIFIIIFIIVYREAHFVLSLKFGHNCSVPDTLQNFIVDLQNHEANEKNCTHSFARNEELLGRAINFLQQEDDFNQLVIIANKTFDIQTQNENKQITFYDFQELNEKTLDVLTHDIAITLPGIPIILLATDSEWKTVQHYVRTHVEESLFWIRLVHSDHQLTNNRHEECTFELSSSFLQPYDSKNASWYSEDQKNLLNQVSVTEDICNARRKLSLITAVGVFGGSLFEVDHKFLDQENEIVCEIHNSYPCSKPLDIYGTNWTLTCCAGIVVELASKVFEKAGYNWVLYIAPDGSYGGFKNCSDPEDPTTCQWNGMVNELREERADIAIAAMTITEARLSVMDFTEDIFVTRIAVALRNSPEKLSFFNWKFIQSLDASLIIGVSVNLLLLFGALYFLEKIASISNPISKKYPIKESFSYGAGLTFQRDLAGKTPDNWSARTVAISYAVALTIIMSTYMANLTATNVVTESHKDFRGLYDDKILHPTPDFKYGVADSSSTASLLSSAATWKDAYLEFVQNYLTSGSRDGIAKVYSGELDAFIEEYYPLSVQQSKKREYCENIIIKQEELVIPNAFGTQRKSPLTHIFSKAIRDLKDKKFVEILFEKWIKTCSETELKAFQFEFEYAGGMVILVGIFLLIALVVFILETIYVHWRTKNGVIKPNLSDSV
ncbi:probable glutamate receptor [Clytia hemisphaerica]|uniref:probable glutamate receptor n=1 Tax=Clytia hemisphaerica TaxID=252671 RepID=UPI0034D61D85